MKSKKFFVFSGTLAMALVFGFVLAGCATSAGSETPPAPTVESETSLIPNGNDDTYAIGDTGPGGGIVFYDKGSVSDGWRYLECAPVSTETWAKWGKSSTDFVNATADEVLAADEMLVGGTATGIGTGAANTQAIVAKLSTLGISGRAAQICDELVYGGKDDWFLPSKDELYEIYRNLAAKSLGDFPNHGAVHDADQDWYWSSSEDNITRAWSQLSGNDNDGDRAGSQSKIKKNRTQRVRAVRAF